MNRATSSTGWVRNPVMKSLGLDPTQASSYELGWTWNPLTGCLNGCPYCYARKLANTRLKERYLANENYATTVDFRNGLYRPDARAYIDPFYPRFWPERLNDPLGKAVTKGRTTTIYGHKPRGIFVCDMSDLFGIGIPEDWTKQVLEVITDCPQHRFYTLTKQPQNLARWSPFPDNCYVGTTITSAEYTHGKGIGSAMEQVTASMIYLSIEPLLGRVTGSVPWYVKWIIIGGLTCGGADLSRLSGLYPDLTPKPYGYRYVLLPKREWVDEIVAAADSGGIPVFLKNNLKPLLGDNLRQEMPQ